MDNNLALATREVLWGIPPLFKAIMYCSMFIAFGFLIAGFRKRLSYVLADGEKISDAYPEKIPMEILFKEYFLYG